MPVAAPAPPPDYRAEFPISGHAIHVTSRSPGALWARSRARVNGLPADLPLLPHRPGRPPGRHRATHP